MSRSSARRATPTTRDQRQMSLLGALGVEPLVEVPEAAPVPAGQCDDDQRLRRGLNELIKASGKSREDIAARMSQLTGQSITVAMLYTWTGPSRTNNFPLRYLRALIIACEADAAGLLDRVLQSTGYAAVDQQAAALARLGQLYALMTWTQSEAGRLTAALPVTGGR